jgi:hypothetical protein
MLCKRHLTRATANLATLISSKFARSLGAQNGVTLSLDPSGFCSLCARGRQGSNHAQSVFPGHNRRQGR